MATESCGCGFIPDDSLELADHLNEMFTPDDDMGADRQVHHEQAGGRNCSCGYTATTTDDLDAHFRVAFPPPADRIGHDGKKHAQLPARPPTYGGDFYCSGNLTTPPRGKVSATV